MTPVYIDFETYWSTTHSLTRMPPTEYVMHPDTEIQAVAIKVSSSPTAVFFGASNIQKELNSIDWSDKIAIGHNMSGFDSMILAWRFGIKPKMWGCTQAMAMSKYKKTCGVSLKNLSKEFNIGAKLSLEATNTKGKRLADFTPTELESMKEYNKVDTDLCAKLFKELAKGISKAEMVQIDMTTRMLVEPKFNLDYRLIREAQESVKAEKSRSLRELAEQIGIDDIVDEVSIEEQVRTQLASSAKFSELLESLGIDPPMKQSPTNPAKMTPALAKTDEEFIKLQEHANPIVAAAARARLEVKSTLLETRLEAFIRAADACGGKLPVPLRYCGADTTGRWSGEQYNMQNLPRIGKNPKPSDALRMSLLAPKGYKVIVADLSGIELRVNHYLWKVPSSMEMYASDAEADLYRAFAAARYDIAPDAVTKDQRQLAKVAQLGLGFGAGAPTFKRVAKLMGGLELTDAESLSIVTDWREQYSDIVDGWKSFQKSLTDLMQGNETAIDPWGMCVTEHKAVRLPSGRRIYYPELRKEVDNGKHEWWYGAGRHKARIYAGKGVENLVQALARDVLAGNALEFRKRTQMSPALMVHDELVYVVPETYAETLLKELQNIMRTPPAWWPELVTWSEGDIADCYGEAK